MHLSVCCWSFFFFLLVEPRGTEKEEFKRLFGNLIMIRGIRIIIPSGETLRDSERFELWSHFTSRWNLIVFVNPDSTLVESDWRFDNLSGSHLQSNSELLTSIDVSTHFDYKMKTFQIVQTSVTVNNSPMSGVRTTSTRTIIFHLLIVSSKSSVSRKLKPVSELLDQGANLLITLKQYDDSGCGCEVNLNYCRWW